MAPRLINATILAGLISLASCGQHISGLGGPVEDQTQSGPDHGDNGSSSGGAGGISGSGTNGGGSGGGDPLSGTTSSGLDPDRGGDAPEPVPEPATMLLFGTGLSGLALLRRRRKNSATAAEQQAQ